MAIQVSGFDEVREEFLSRVRRIVWCNVATVDSRNRPRSRILHPIWEGPTGWILTRRHSLKEKHIGRNAHVSLCYWDPNQEQVYAECTARWLDGAADKQRLWDLFKNTPAPVGYDPGLLWPGPSDPTFGVLELTPWRVEICSLEELMSSTNRVWTA